MSFVFSRLSECPHFRALSLDVKTKQRIVSSCHDKAVLLVEISDPVLLTYFRIEAAQLPAVNQCKFLIGATNFNG